MTSKYSIKDLERLSGIKAHTLRVWESRYNLIKPKRTETNIRYYTDEDLKHILNVAVLVNSGIRISKVALMEREELHARVLDASMYHGQYESQINTLKIAMLDFDESLFNRVMTNAVMEIGADKTFTRIIGAFIEQVGLLWQTGAITLVHEHFISNLIKQKLFVTIDRIQTSPPKNAGTYLLFLPRGEFHELGLLYLNYYLKCRSCNTVYLGQDVPSEYLGEVCARTGVKALVGLITTSPTYPEIDRYFHKLGEILPGENLQFYFSGYQLREYENREIDPRFKIAKNIPEMCAILPL